MQLTNIFILIPVYNESTILQNVISGVQSAGYPNIIIIDDGSTDNTCEIVSKNKNITMVSHSINRGKGAALKTGVEAAKMLGADIVVTIDGDGQHNPSDIKKMIKLLHAGNDVVLGSRIINSKGMPFLKLGMNYFGNFCTWILYGLWVSDSQSGFRAYSKKAIEMINTQAGGYEYDSEIIKEIRRNKLKFVEIPIEVLYTDYSMNKKNKMTLKEGVNIFINMVISS